MGKRQSILKTEFGNHAAVLAWQGLSSTLAEPDHIEVLKQGRKGAVYRLAGIGNGGSAVIAKRCRPDKGMVERTVYEHVLPRLAESPLNYYGSVEESDGTANWLFLEDVGDQRYNPDLDLHRSRAGRWFGEMQAVVNRDDLPDTFPDRGADSYRDCLQTIFHAIPKFRDQGPVRRLGGDTLERITHSCRQLQARWDDVVEMCASVPIVFSHNDCLPKNVHVRQTAAGFAIAPFDWGGAGWAPAGTDLGLLALPQHGSPCDVADCSAYVDAVAERWPHLRAENISRLANIGQLFWALKVISRGLLEIGDVQNPEHMLEKLKIYLRTLERSLAITCPTGRSVDDV